MAERKITDFKDLPAKTAQSLNDIAQFVVTMNEQDVVDTVKDLLSDGVSPLDIFAYGLISGMSTISEKFKNGDAYVTEVLLAAQVMDSGMELIMPHIDNSTEQMGCIVLGTVEGDLHDIGKKMVSMMLRNIGCRVIDLGVDVPAEQFARAIKEYHPQIIGMSALLTTTTGQIRKTINFLIKAGLRYQVKIIIGGSPINQAFADNVGADGYSDDAFEAVDLCRKLLAESNIG